MTDETDTVSTFYTNGGDNRVLDTTTKSDIGEVDAAFKENSVSFWTVETDDDDDVITLYSHALLTAGKAVDHADITESNKSTTSGTKPLPHDESSPMLGKAIVVESIIVEVAPEAKPGLLMESFSNTNSKRSRVDPYVCAVKPSSCLQGMVQPGDFLVTINGRDVTNRTALQIAYQMKTLRKHEPRRNLVMGFERRDFRPVLYV